MNEHSKDLILAAALPDVTFDGWTGRVLDRAAQKTGTDGDRLSALFPKGVLDLVSHFSDWADRQMLARLDRTALEKSRIRDKIALCVQTRLDVLAPHKDALRQALGLYALPWNKPRAARSLWRTADVIWHAAGDTATDYNHYTKRLLLSGVLASTTLCFLNDDSDGHAETRAFLERRIDNVLQIGRAAGKFRKRA